MMVCGLKGNTCLEQCPEMTKSHGIDGTANTGIVGQLTRAMGEWLSCQSQSCFYSQEDPARRWRSRTQNGGDGLYRIPYRRQRLGRGPVYGM